MSITKEIKPRSEYFDNIKGLLIFLVVVGHFCDGTISKPINSIISLFHMPAFVFTTGYFAKNLFKNNKFCWNKVSFIFLTYIIAQVLEAICSGNKFTLTLTPLYGLWYLLATSVWYCICRIIGPSQNYTTKKIISILLIITICSILYPLFINNETFDPLRISYTPFFFIGYFTPSCTKQKIKEIILSKKIYFMWIIIISFVLVLTSTNFLESSITTGTKAWIQNRNQDFSYNSYGQFTFYFLRYYIIPFLIVILLLCIIPSHKCIFTQLGQRTLPIYLFHCIFIHQERAIIQKLFNYCPSTIHFIIPIIIAILITYLLSTDLFYKATQRWNKLHQKIFSKFIKTTY